MLPTRATRELGTEGVGVLHPGARHDLPEVRLEELNGELELFNVEELELQTNIAANVAAILGGASK